MSAASPRGRRAATVSVALGVLALVARYSITTFHLLDHVQLGGMLPSTEAPEAVWVVLMTALGIAAASTGLIGLVRGTGWTRVAALLGMLLAVFALFIGTLPLWFSPPNPLGTGSFD